MSFQHNAFQHNGFQVQLPGSGVGPGWYADWGVSKLGKGYGEGVSIVNVDLSGTITVSVSDNFPEDVSHANILPA